MLWAHRLGTWHPTEDVNLGESQNLSSVIRCLKTNDLNFCTSMTIKSRTGDQHRCHPCDSPVCCPGISSAWRIWRSTCVPVSRVWAWPSISLLIGLPSLSTSIVCFAVLLLQQQVLLEGCY